MITAEPLTRSERTSRLSFNRPHFEENVKRLTLSCLEEFKQITRASALFHLIFVGIAAVEGLSFLLFFSFFMKSALLAFTIAGICLTVFTYFVLHYYFEAKKPDQFERVSQRFMSECQEMLPFPEGSSERHLSLSQALIYFSHQLPKQEYTPLPHFSDALSPLIRKFNTWAHWKDILTLREKLLLRAIKENISYIKHHPTDLEGHAALAQAFVALSKLYVMEESDETPWVPKDYHTPEMQAKFQEASRQAIEEFTILDTFAPNDRWVHSQLAAVYHDLKMPEQEIHAYERLLTIAPQDRDILFHLGKLYFQEGLNAKALAIYQKLLALQDMRADELIQFYGSAVLSN